MPYRVDIRRASAGTIERLIDLGALDVDTHAAGEVAAVMPDRVSPTQLASAIGDTEFHTSPATGRDADSVWVLAPRAVRVAGVDILPATAAPRAGSIRLADTPAFGTGLHPTTALCIEAIAEAVAAAAPGSMLDVGTGSGLLALAALSLGVTRVDALDTDAAALAAAAGNARLNGFEDRLRLRCGEVDAVDGRWPLVVANIMAAPLIEMAPTLVRRLGRGGWMVLSGIPTSVERDVADAYLRLGLQHAGTRRRGGWVALTLRASW